MFALVACTGSAEGLALPDPAELDVTAPLLDGFSGGAGALIDPSADPPARISFDLQPGTYVLRVACTSVDGSETQVTLELGDARVDPVTHLAACGAADESGFVAITTESEPFDAPGGDVAVIGTASVFASFNISLVKIGA
jgi:hypothetical protein